MLGLTINELLEEQRTSANLAVIEAIPHDKENVRVVPWRQGTKCVFQKGVIVPRRAIKEITKTGTTVHCCNQILQVVAITFVDEKLVTYSDLLRAVQTSHPATGMPSRIDFGSPMQLLHRRNCMDRPWWQGGGGLRGAGVMVETTAVSETRDGWGRPIQCKNAWIVAEKNVTG